MITEGGSCLKQEKKGPALALTDADERGSAERHKESTLIYSHRRLAVPDYYLSTQ